MMTRHGLIIGAALTVLTGLSWAYLYHDATVGHCSRMGLAGTATDFAMLLVMWTVMMAAMMLPSAAPMILMFANVNRQRAAHARTALPTSYFVLAYLLIWTAFSLAATAVQWWLSSAALLTPMSMELVSRPAAAGLLLVAGMFQWTPLKHACLQHCHTPFTFLMRYWRDGRRGAFQMGIRHGLYCVGCCWAVMALLFVAGVMNLLWVLALSILVLFEKLVPRLARPAGAAMIAAGFVVLASGAGS
jgi:predicted metal-binding membrane protein